MGANGIVEVAGEHLRAAQQEFACLVRLGLASVVARKAHLQERDWPPDASRSARRFVEREIAPFVNEWDEAGSFPRELYRKAAAIGLIGMGYPEDLGGTPADLFFGIVAAEEIARAGCGGLQASLGSHGIGLPPVVAHGSEALKRRIVPPVLRPRKRASEEALSMDHW